MIPERCTWKDGIKQCCNPATHPQIAKDGDVWARLCCEHNTLVESTTDPANMLKPGGPARALSCWIKAQGGPEAAAARLVKC